MLEKYAILTEHNSKKEKWYEPD